MIPYCLRSLLSHKANQMTAMTMTASTTHGVSSSRPNAWGDAIKKEVHTTVMKMAGISVMIYAW